ncbi:MAG: filamentous hemagglutinin family protein, partial [Verrucomicrobiales bacterium]
LLAAIWFVTMASLLMWQVEPYANPHEPNVVRGSVEFDDVLDGHLKIHQTSGTAVIDWEGFSIDVGEITEFYQPNSKSAALNRVRGAGTSIIDGQLSANGRIFLINPNGVIIGAGGRVDVGGFVASTLDLNLDEFERGGDLNFNGGSQAAIVNLGQIGASDGDIFLIAASVQNLGTLTAPDGTVGLAAGNSVLIKADGEERVFVKGAAGSQAIGVDSQGVIQAQVAELKAHGGNVYALAIRNEGRIAATTLSNEGGRVFIRANGGKIRNNGQVVARGPGGGAGKIEITAGAGPNSEVTLGELSEINAGSEAGSAGAIAIQGGIIRMQPGSAIRANGDTDGGSIEIGADPDLVPIGEMASTQINIPNGVTIHANGRNGVGGTIAIQGGVASELRIGGDVRARGGLGDGGAISMRGDNVRVLEGGLIDAGGETNGGTISLAARTARVDGEIRSVGRTGDGGVLDLAIEEELTVSETGILNASGEGNGGRIAINAAEEAIVNIAGQLLAPGRVGNGGEILIDGAEEINVSATGFLNASGKGNGGTITLAAEGTVDFQGTALASGTDGNGGLISVSGVDGVTVGVGALLDAGGGTNGGAITVASSDGSVDFLGTALAAGGSGDGGSITVSGAEGATIGPNAFLDASGGGNGGSILVDGGNGITDFQGTAIATGGSGIGGTISLAGATINVSGSAAMDASGATGGGTIAIGDADSRNVSVAPGATLAANAVESGDGGSVTFAASQNLNFQGNVSASGVGTGGVAEFTGQAAAGIDLGDLVNRVNLEAAAAGSLVVSPDDLNVVGAGQIGGLSDQGINDWLETGANLRLQANAGNISIGSAVDIDFSGGGELALEAAADITMESGAQIDAGQSGSISMLAAGEVSISSGAGLTAGSISAEAGDSLTFAGLADASNSDGVGGRIDLTAPELSIETGSVIDASGTNGGGVIRIGGGRRGRDTTIANATNTTVDAGAVILANGGAGDGGNVTFWANGVMDYRGAVEARGGAGGFVEVSGLEQLEFAGTVDTGGGQLLLDPFNYTIGAVEAGNIVTALASNNVTIDTTADVGTHGSSGNVADTGIINVNSNIFYDSTFDLTFLALADANFNASVQNRNATGGDVNVVAGWDGTTAFNSATFLAEDHQTTTVYGQNNGSVNIGDGTQTAGVAVGSRTGQNNVFGYDVNVLAGNGAGNNRFAQLGFQVTDGIALDGTNLGAAPAVNGAINVRARNTINATAGDTGQYTYAQIGHVGADFVLDAVVDAAANAAIDVRAGADITFTGGGNFDAYAQLGHGGAAADGAHSGTVTLRDSGALTFSAGTGAQSYAQLGHGGISEDTGANSGDILIENVGDIAFTGGGTVGVNANAYAQLGHGGLVADGAHSGAVTIRDSGALTFTAGVGQFSYAQLGHGGYSEDSGDNSGDILIENLGNITFAGGGDSISYAQLGHGGYVGRGAHSGSVTLRDSGNLTISAGNGSFAYAQLGHGGLADNAGDDSGAILIENLGNIAVNGGGASSTYAQIGHGGVEADGNPSGSISITAAGNLTLTGQDVANRYALIGHGDEPAGAGDTDAGNTVQGTISLDVAGNISFTNAFLGNLIDNDGTNNGGDLAIISDAIAMDANSSVVGAGALTIAPQTASRAINLGSGVGGLDLSSVELANLQDGFSSITIGDAVAGAGQVGVIDATFTDPLTLVGGGMILTGLNAGTNNVILNARTSGIFDGPGTTLDVTAGNLAVFTAAGFGLNFAGGEIETAVTGIEVDGGTGGIFASNTGDVTIGGVDAGLTGLSTTNADITFSSSGNITVSEAIGSSGGNVSLAATGASQDIDLNAALNAGGGNVTLSATRNLAIRANTSTSGAGFIDVDAGKTINLTNSALVSAVNGAITFDANTGGATAGNFVGVIVNNGTVQSTGSGSITVNGQGGDSGNGNYGIHLQAGGDIISSGSGAVTLNGTGGSTTGDGSHGLRLDGAGTTITSSSGAISINGQATGTGSDNQGIVMVNSALIQGTGAAALDLEASGSGTSGGFTVINGVIESSSGSIDISATAPSGSGFGLVSGGIVRSGSGNISITGETPSNDDFLIINAGTSIESTSGDISLVGNTFRLDAPATISSSGALSIGPRDAATSIGIGNGATGTLNISSAELAQLTDGFSSITIGGSVTTTETFDGPGLPSSLEIGTGSPTVSGGFLNLAANSVVRTIATDFTHSFVAEVDWVRGVNGDIAFGLGSDTSNPDARGAVGYPSAVFLAIDNGVEPYARQSGAGFNGTLRLTYDSVTGQLTPEVIRPGQSNLNLGPLDISDNGFNGTNSQLYVQGGGSTMTIDNFTFTRPATGAVDIQAATFNDPITIGGGDITVNGALSAAAGNNLSLQAGNNLVVDGNLTTTGAGAIDIDVGREFQVLNDAQITTVNGGIDININPTQQAGQFRGLQLGGDIISSGTGNIVIETVGGDTNNSTAALVAGAGSTIQSTGTGTIDITATGRANAPAIGLNTGGVISSAIGNINISATHTGSGLGLSLQNSGQINSTGSANITINATAGGDNVLMSGPAAQIGGPSATGNITINTDDLNITDGVIQTSGALTIAPITASTTIGIGGGAGTLDLSAAALGTLQDGFSSITIGHAAGTGAVTVNAVTFNDPVTLRSPNAGGSIAVNGQITGAGDASITLDGPGATTTFGVGGGISTEGDAITISDSVVLNANTVLDTTAGAMPAGANITVGGAVTGNGNDFTANAGTGGALSLAALNNIGTLSLSGDSMSFSGAVGASSGLTLNAANGISLTGAAADFNISGGAVNINADSDGNGTGSFAINDAGGSLVSNNNNVNLTAAAYDFTGTINAGTGTVTLLNSVNGGAINIGNGFDATVDTANDTVDGTTTSITALLANRGIDGKISLGEAIAANNNTGAGVIGFDPALDGSPINVVSQLDISNSLTLQGNGARNTLIDGGNSTRVFAANISGITVNFNDLTIRNANASEGAGVQLAGNGGTVNFNRVRFTGNTTPGNGAAIYVNTGNATANININESLFDGNFGGGGTIVVFPGATVNVRNTTITGNTGNPAFLSQFNGGGSATILNSTITGNSHGIESRNSGSITVINSIVAGNTGNNFVAGGGAANNVVSGGNNIVDSAANFNSVGSDVIFGGALNTLIGGLANNGGPTDTHALAGGSVAIDAGSNAAAAALTTDQRGTARIFNTTVDVGAFESGSSGSFAPFAGGFVQDALLDQITAANLVIGNASAGAINVDQALTLSTSGNLSLLSGGVISVNNSIANTGGGISLDGGAATLLNGNLTTAGGAISVADNASLGADFTADATNGGAAAAGANVTFGGTVTGSGSARNFTANAGAGGTLSIGGNIGAGGLINDVDLDALSFTYGDDLTAQGNVTVDTKNNIALTSGSSMTVGNGNLTLNAHLNFLQGTNTIYRGIDLDNATLTATGTGSISLVGRARTPDFSGATTIHGIRLAGAGTLITTGNGNIVLDGIAPQVVRGGNNHAIMIENGAGVIATGTGNVSIVGLNLSESSLNSNQNGVVITGTGSRVGSNSGTLAITGTGGHLQSSEGINILDSGEVSSTSGDITLTGTIKSNNGNHNTQGAGILYDSATPITTTGTINLITGGGTFNNQGVGARLLLSNGSISGGTGVNIRAADGSSIDLGSAVDTATNGLELSAAELARITSTSPIVIGHGNSGDITVSDAIGVAVDGFSLITGSSINVNNPITNTGGFLLLQGPATTTNLNADLTTNGSPITISDSVVLGATNISLNTTAGGNPTGANVSITGAIDADAAANVRNLTINAGSGGGITFGGAIGSTERIDALNLTANSLTFGGGLTTDGALSLTTANGITLTGANADFNIGGTVTIDADSDANGTGTFSIDDAGGSIDTNGNDLQVTAAGIILDGTINAGAGNVSFVQSQAGIGISFGTAPASSLIYSPGTLLFNGGGNQGSHVPANMLNQNGLSANYVSGVTDFSTYSGTTHAWNAPGNANLFLSAIGNVDFNLDLDLGSSLALHTFVLWLDHAGRTSRLPDDFEILLSDDITFATSTTVLNQDSPSPLSVQSTANQIAFTTPATGRYVRFDFNSSKGHSDYQIGEIAFLGAPAGPPANGFNFTDAELSNITANNLNIGNASHTGTFQTFGDTSAAVGQLNLSSGSTIDISHNLTNTGGGITVDGAATTLGAALTGAGAITINDNLTLDGYGTVDATNGGSLEAGGNVAINGSVTGSGSTQNFTVDAGTFGALSIGGDVGGTGLINDVDFNALSFTYANELTAQGNVAVNAVRNIFLSPSSTITTTTGSIDLTGNSDGIGTGNFSGVYVGGGIDTTSGAITLIGMGGDNGNDNVGVRLFGGVINSTGTGPAVGALTIDGTGGTGGANENHGVRLEDGAEINTVDGNLALTGFGGISGAAGSKGVYLVNSDISSTGTGANAGSLTLVGSGADDTIGLIGFEVSSGAVVSTVDGEISITGTGGSGSSDFNDGVLIFNEVLSTGTGGITINGTAGDGVNSNAGVELVGGSALVQAVNGNISITGVADGTGASDNDGVAINNSAAVRTTGAGNIDITGTGTASGTGRGIFIQNGGVAQATGAGNLTLTGTGVGEAGIENAATVSTSTGDLSLIANTVALTGTTSAGTGIFSVTAGGTVDLTQITTPGTLNITGLAGNDTILLDEVATNLSVTGGGGTDSVGFNAAAAGVTVNLASLNGVSTLTGSVNTDTLNGTAGSDTFNVTADNAGDVGGIDFTSFENLNGGAGDDSFTFTNQATIDGQVDGGAEASADTLTIDDTDLATNETYTVSDQSGFFRVERNPTYDFTNIETLGLNSGSGNDTVNTEFFSFAQNLNGGGGGNSLFNSGTQVYDPSSPIANTLNPGADITYSNFGNAPPPPPVPPVSPASPPLPPPPPPLPPLPPVPVPVLPPGPPVVTPEIVTNVINEVTNVGQVDTTTQTVEAGGGESVDVGSGQNTVVDNFSAGGSGDAGTTTTQQPSGTATPQQLIAQADNTVVDNFGTGGSTTTTSGGGLFSSGPSQPASSVTGGAGPVSLGGGPPASQQTQTQLTASTSPQAESSLSQALGGDGTTGTSSVDGAVSTDPSDPTPPAPQTEASLGGSTGSVAESELGAALGGDGSVGVTSGDGPSSLSPGGPPPSAGTQESLSASTSPEAASGLSEALGGDGTAPVASGDGSTGIDGSGATATEETQSELETNTGAGAESELSTSLGGSGEVSVDSDSGVSSMSGDGTSASAETTESLETSTDASTESELSESTGGDGTATTESSDGSTSTDLDGATASEETDTSLTSSTSEESYNEIYDVLADSPLGSTGPEQALAFPGAFGGEDGVVTDLFGNPVGGGEAPTGVTAENAGVDAGPLSIGGGPPASPTAQASLQQGISPEVESGLSESLGGDGTSGTSSSDGAVSADPTDTTPPAQQTQESLGGGISPEAESELSLSLGGDGSVGVTSETGPASLTPGGPPPGPATQQTLSDSTSPQAASGMSEALGGDGTAPVESDAGAQAVDPGSGPPNPQTEQNLGSGLSPEAESELGDALGGFDPGPAAGGDAGPAAAGAEPGLFDGIGEPGPPATSVTAANGGVGAGPLSLGGGPPVTPETQTSLTESISPQAESGLSESLGGDGSSGTTGSDGAVSADPSDPTPPAQQTEESLGGGISLEAESELGAALGGDGSVGVTPGTGPASVTPGGPPPGPAAQQSLSQSTSPQTASALSQSLGGDGTAPVESDAGALGVDPGSGSPTPQTEQNLGNSIGVEAENELSAAIGESEL